MMGGLEAGQMLVRQAGGQKPIITSDKINFRY